MSLCPLCNSKGELFYKEEFFLCPTCGGIFKNPEFLLDETKEKERYELHSDDASDFGYQQFVSPIVKSVVRDFKTTDSGLDFGTGQSQIVAKLLQNEGYALKVYDPYFAPIEGNLEKKYDYITACEVIEHFNHPKKEFTLLSFLLRKNGKLYCMTHLYDESIDFAKWYYKNDTTHIFIYQKETIEYIKNSFGFSDFGIDKRLIVFTK
jgi:hypothetical protein